VLDEEISRADTELQAAEQERMALQQSVDRQGLNIQDIDRMNTERDRLQKSLEDTVAALDEVSRHVSDKESEAARKLEDLEAIIKRYNSLGYQMSLIPPTASNAKGAAYELSLNIADAGSAFSSSTSQLNTSQSGSRRRSPDTDRLLADTYAGHLPAQIVNLDLRGTIRQAFISLRKEINERRKAAQETDLNARDILDSVGEALSEKHTEVDTLSHRVHLAQQAHTELRESTATAHTQTTAQIEKLEKELARMREGVERGVMELEQREMEVGVAWEGMREEAGRVREQLHAGVERALEDVIRFKVHVQKGLEDFEGWVGDQVDSESVGDGAVAGTAEDGDGDGGEVFEA
jgi:kinetochore protein NDC80